MSGFDFTDRVFVITGGAQGIGAAGALEAARCGASVYVLDVADDAGRDLASQHDGITYLPVDVSSRQLVLDSIQGIVDRHGRVDGLVCGAVMQPLVTALEIDEQWLARVHGVNLGGVIWSCQAVIPTMIDQGGGSIVLFMSGTADIGKAGSSLYTSSKGAVAGFAKSLSREVDSAGVRVNIYRPGMVDTAQFRNSNPGMDTSHLDRPEDAVGPLLFLLSDYATMTGSQVTREMLFRAPERTAL